jgi:hypothetical protein
VERGIENEKQERTNPTVDVMKVETREGDKRGREKRWLEI